MNLHPSRTLLCTLSLVAISLPALALAEVLSDDLFIDGSLDVSGATAVEELSASHVSSASAQGNSAFYGRQLGDTFTNPQPIFQAVSDHPNGAANWFFRGTIGGPEGTETFSIRADGQIKSANLAGSGTGMLVASADGTVQRTSTAITTTGSNVGIGTDSPADTLTANGNIRALAANNGGFVAYDSPSGGNHLFSLVRGNASNNLDISSYDGIGFATGATGGPSTNYSLFIANNGNVGIGTDNPQHLLQIGKDNDTTKVPLRVGNVDYGSNTVMSVAPGNVYFDAPGVVGGRMTLLGSNGNVGIGTSNPQAPLQIVGPQVSSGASKSNVAILTPSAYAGAVSDGRYGLQFLADNDRHAGIYHVAETNDFTQAGLAFEVSG